MKVYWYGLLLAFQFFTVLPIHKQLPMTKRTLTAMYALLPIIGLLIGVALMGTYELLQLAQVSTLFTAILIVVVHIVLTGGLHLDGYVDVSDAFFSYGEREKRLQILEDPRTGAFGVISVAVLLLLHVGAMNELIERTPKLVPFILIVLPIVGRLGVMLYFSTMKCAKASGLAYYFSTNMQVKQVRIVAISVIVVLSISAILSVQIWLLALICMQCIIVYFYRKWSYKHFGGMNGDLSGAIYEGSQVLLCMMVLLFI